MRLICELCAERGLTAIINIHDVQLAKLYAQRVVGLQQGVIVFDGLPDELNPDMLTRIYGEEDWTATANQDEDKELDSAKEI
jgi:phosphonate transport system ATP-binding protein